MIPVLEDTINLPANVERWALMEKLLAALIHPQPPLLSMALPRWAIPVDARHTWPWRSCHQPSHCVGSAWGPWTHLHCFAFGRSDCSRNRNVCGGRCTSIAMDNCYHANKSPNFHLPPGLTPAPREVPHGSSRCMSAEMQLLGLPPCLASSTNTHLCGELCPCSASQTYARLPGDIASSSWAGSF